MRDKLKHTFKDRRKSGGFEKPSGIEVCSVIPFSLR